MSYAQLLSSVEIFADLNADQIAKIERMSKVVVFRKGEVIFEENSPSNEFYIIVKGTVDIQLDPDLIIREADAHEPHTIVTLRRGQSFGEVALVDHGVRSASSISSSRNCILLMISRNDFMNLLQQDLEMGFTVMKNLASDLCFKIRNTNLMVREGLIAS